MINYDIYKGKNTSQSGFSLTIPGLTGIDFEPMLGRKIWSDQYRNENFLEQRIVERSNNNSTHLWRGVDAYLQYLSPVYLCGRRVLSPLRTPCFP